MEANPCWWHSPKFRYGEVRFMGDDNAKSIALQHIRSLYRLKEIRELDFFSEENGRLLR